MDDEGWGLRSSIAAAGPQRALPSRWRWARCGRVRLLLGAGFGSNIQFGYFPHHRLGLLANLFAGRRNPTAGPPFSVTRSAGEVQCFRSTCGAFTGRLWSRGRAIRQGSVSRLAHRTGFSAAAQFWRSLSPTRLNLMARGDWKPPPAPRQTAQAGPTARRSPADWRSTEQKIGSVEALVVGLLALSSRSQNINPAPPADQAKGKTRMRSRPATLAVLLRVQLAGRQSFRPARGSARGCPGHPRGLRANALDVAPAHDSGEGAAQPAGQPFR